jgi:hypothetical protein
MPATNFRNARSMSDSKRIGCTESKTWQEAQAVQLLPVRLTIGRLMIVVALLAIALGGEVARRRWIASRRPALSRSHSQAVALAAKHLGPKHWAASRDLALMIHDQSRGYWLYARDYQRLSNGDRLALGPFAVVWRSPDGRNVRTVTGDLASLDLHSPMGSGKGIAGLNLGSARMEGNVVFTDNNSTPKRDDDSVSMALPRVEFDQASLNRMGGLSVQPLPR